MQHVSLFCLQFLSDESTCFLRLIAACALERPSSVTADSRIGGCDTNITSKKLGRRYGIYAK